MLGSSSPEESTWLRPEDRRLLRGWSGWGEAGEDKDVGAPGLGTTRLHPTALLGRTGIQTLADWWSLLVSCLLKCRLAMAVDSQWWVGTPADLIAEMTSCGTFPGRPDQPVRPTSPLEQLGTPLGTPLGTTSAANILRVVLLAATWKDGRNTCLEQSLSRSCRALILDCMELHTKYLEHPWNTIGAHREHCGDAGAVGYAPLRSLAAVTLPELLISRCADDRGGAGRAAASGRSSQRQCQLESCFISLLTLLTFVLFSPSARPWLRNTFAR